MNLSVVQTRGRDGIAAPPVRVEVFLGMGLPGLSLVGMPDASVREAKERVRAALLSSQFGVPSRRITINLSPAELPKEGGGFDLAIAIGILAANSDVPLPFLRDTEFIGELALTGGLQSVRGVLPAVIAALQAGHRVIVPYADAAIVAGLSGDVRCARTLHEVVAYARGRGTLPTAQKASAAPMPPTKECGDFADVQGQLSAKLALEIAAAGEHHALLYGPPGCGKTMLAERLPSIMPPLSPSAAMEVQIIASVANQALPDPGRPPFRAPHHSSSTAALIGGGAHAGIGEITLAHNGVLFLDELSHWSRVTLDLLRQPIQSGYVSVARVRRAVNYPSRFQLIAASNLCPCGANGTVAFPCKCTVIELQRFRRKLSAALMDRIDLQVKLLPVSSEDMRITQRNESSASVRARVVQARTRQLERAGKPNAQLTAAELKRFCTLDTMAQRYLDEQTVQDRLSARGIHRVVRVARTIADLEDAKQIDFAHIHRAVSFRQGQAYTS